MAGAPNVVLIDLLIAAWGKSNTSQARGHVASLTAHRAHLIARAEQRGAA